MSPCWAPHKGGSSKGFHTTKEGVAMKGSNPIIPPGAQFDGARRGRSICEWRVVVVLMHMGCLPVFFCACKQRDEGETQGNREGNGRHREPAARTGALAGADDPNPLPTLPALPNAGSILPPLPTEGSTGVPPVPLPTTPAVPLPVAPAPSIPNPALSTQAVGGTEYVIASGDNFWTIGRKFGVSAKQINSRTPAWCRLG